MSRNRTSYNLIRVVAMLMVLAVHVSNECEQFMEPYNKTWYLNSIFTCIAMIANPLFFMLSGKFNLNKRFETLQDYFIFYYKKIISIFVPLLVFSIIVFLVKYNPSDWSIMLFIKGFLNNEIEGVYWFVYALGCILVFSPFFSKMLQSMSRLDKTMFFWVLIAVNSFITIYLMKGTNAHMNYNSVGIISWHLFYFIGYLLEDVIQTRKEENVLIALGGVGLVVQFLLDRFVENLAVPLYDPTPWMIFEGIAVYLLLLRVDFGNGKLAKVIDKIAEVSFVFYLLHMLIVNMVVKWFPLHISASVNAICFVVIFIISFVIIISLAFPIVRFLLKPFTKYANDLFLKRLKDK